MWAEIRGLIDEGFDELAAEGFCEDPTFDAVTKGSEVIGAVLVARDEDGFEEELLVNFPKGWTALVAPYAVDQRGCTILRRRPKPGTKFFCFECGEMHTLIASEMQEGAERFFYCDGKLKLGSLDKVSYVGDPADRDVKKMVHDAQNEVPL